MLGWESISIHVPLHEWVHRGAMAEVQCLITLGAWTAHWLLPIRLTRLSKRCCGPFSATATATSRATISLPCRSCECGAWCELVIGIERMLAWISRERTRVNLFQKRSTQLRLWDDTSGRAYG